MPYIPEKKPEPAGSGGRKETKAEKRRKLFLPVAAVLSCLLIAYGAARLIGYGRELSASRQTSRELQELYRPEPAEEEAAPTAEPAPTDVPAATEIPEPEQDSGVLPPVAYPDNPELKVSARFRKLREKSGYIIGWLSLDGVEEAVALKDNTFFLNHDAAGKRNSNGAIFLDADASLLTRPYTVILYGHNMKSGHMFGRLKKYLENAYAGTHRIITFDSLYEEGKYAVFAAEKFSTEPGTAKYYDLWSLTSDDRETREKAIRKLESRSAYASMLDVQADEQILLLVTCVGGDTDRLVVAARRLRDTETEERLNYKKK